MLLYGWAVLVYILAIAAAGLVLMVLGWRDFRPTGPEPPNYPQGAAPGPQPPRKGSEADEEALESPADREFRHGGDGGAGEG